MLRGGPLAALVPILALVLAPLSLGACAGADPAGETPFLSPQARVLELPLLRQDEMYACGLVSLSALCGYHGVEVPAEETERLAALAREMEGLSGEEVRSALEGLGFEVFLFRGSLDREVSGLYGHVDRGRPLIVMVSEEGERHHYALFLGYDEPRESVVLLDPVRGHVVLPASSFAQAWERSQRFTLLALPRGV